MKKQQRVIKKIKWSMTKYYRWFRSYVKRIRQVERELGGELTAC